MGRFPWGALSLLPVASVVATGCAPQGRVTRLPEPLTLLVPTPSGGAPYGSASPDAAYGALLAELRLTDSPRLPTDHLADEASRKRVEEAHRGDARASGCRDFRVEASSLQGSRVSAVVSHGVGTAQGRAVALVELPAEGRDLVLVVYAHGGFGGVLERTEFAEALGTGILRRSVIAAPLFPGEKLEFEGRTYTTSLPPGTFVSDVDGFYALTTCFQHHLEGISAGGVALGDVLRPSGGQVPGPKTIAAGQGRGGLVALLAAARSGAWAMTPAADVSTFAHYECGLLFHPQISLYAAEARLLLQALVKGNTEESRYRLLPGLVDLRAELFRAWREKSLSTASLAFQILRRDGLMAMPLVDLALKDFGGTPNDRGPPYGSLAVLHGRRRTDYPVNVSRILANVATTVRFETSESTNAMTLLYREFEGEEVDERLSYMGFLGSSFPKSLGDIIPSPFVSVSPAVPADEYRYLIRGSEWPDSLGRTPAETAQSFLRQSCGLL